MFVFLVNSCLLASAKNTNIIGPVKSFDNRTLARKRRKLAQTKAPEAMMTLLDTAQSAGLNVDYVLFDSWFFNPAQITTIHKKGMDVIAMIKKSSRIKYSYYGKQLNIKEIYSRNKKRRGRLKFSSKSVKLCWTWLANVIVYLMMHWQLSLLILKQDCRNICVMHSIQRL